MAEPVGEGSWHAVPVPLPAAGRVIGFELAGTRVLLCNVGGEPYALRDECPHVRVPLSGGRLEGSVLECPLHGGKIDVRDGSPQALPIRRPAQTYPVRASAGGLEIQLS